MKGYKRSPLCSNCGRDKRLVTVDLEQYSGWLSLPYCQECASRQCRDVTYFEPCSNRQSVEHYGEHPAQYRDFCAEHWPQYGLCPKCRNPKEAWMPLCWQCHNRAELLRLHKLQLQRRRQEIVQEKAAKAIRTKRRKGKAGRIERYQSSKNKELKQ